jgi:hypothetical protein
MASHILRDGRFPVATNVSVYLASQKGVPSNPQVATPGGSAPAGAAVAGPFAVAADGSLSTAGLVDGTAYTAYALVGSIHTYADFKTDNGRLVEPGRESRQNEPMEDERRRLWLPGGAISETMPRSDVVSGAVPLASGTLLLAGGAVLPKGKPVSRVAFVSGTTLRTPGTNEWFCIVRQSDLTVLAVTVDELAAALAANTLRELALAVPYTPTDDTAVYLGMVSVGGTPPSLAGVVLNNAAIAGALTTPPLCGTSSTGLTTPVAVGSTVAAITPTVNLAYALVR